MTIRGAGVPRKPWLSCRCARMGPPPRSFAADAHECIMVRVVTAHRIQGCGTMIVPDKRVPLDIVIPTAPSAPSCSKLSRSRLASVHEEMSE